MAPGSPLSRVLVQTVVDIVLATLVPRSVVPEMPEGPVNVRSVELSDITSSNRSPGEAAAGITTDGVAVLPTPTADATCCTRLSTETPSAVTSRNTTSVLPRLSVTVSLTR